jgi:NAD+ kinase
MLPPPSTADESSVDADAVRRALMPAPTETMPMPPAFTHPILTPPNPDRELATFPPGSHARPPAAVLQSQSPARCRSSSVSAVGGLLLRDYARTADPSTTDQEIHVRETLGVHPQSAGTAHQQAEAQRSADKPAPISPLHHLRSFQSHRKGTLSIDTIPRQTIMKALASRPPINGNPPSFPLVSSLNGVLNGRNRSNSGSVLDVDQQHPQEGKNSASSQKLSAALNSLQSGSAYSDKSSSATARLALQSPCFFHQRFDDAVNIQKVLEEIADDEWLSHSRLMQTATGVREVSKQLQRRPIKRAVKTIMIVTKARDNRLVYLTREITEWLLSSPRYGNDLGITVYVDFKLRNSKRFDAAGLLAKNPRYESMLKFWTPDLCWTSPEKFDLVLTLGGDGTVLFTSWLFQRIVPPILSFSLGSLGFLTNFEFEKYKEHLNHIMGDGGMRVNLRMRFTCTVYRADRSKGAVPGDVEEGEQFEVLNELVIDRGPSPYVSNLELYGDNELLTVIQADGCIFSTPTGKTILKQYVISWKLIHR